MRGYDRHHPHFRLHTADGRAVDDGFFAIVLNTNPYTYLGNMPIDLSPAATLDDPLVVVTFRTLRVLPILRGLGSALRGNGVRTSEQLLLARGPGPSGGPGAPPRQQDQILPLPIQM